MSRETADFESALEELFEPYRLKGKSVDALVAIAYVLQRHLAINASNPDYHGGHIRYADPLEMIMRGVISVLNEEGREEAPDGCGGYMSTKLRIGIFNLFGKLYEDMPGFRKAENEAEKRGEPQLVLEWAKEAVRYSEIIYISEWL